MIRVETQSLHEQFLMGIVKNVKDSYYLIYYVKILESSSVFCFDVFIDFLKCLELFFSSSVCIYHLEMTRCSSGAGDAALTEPSL